MTHRVLLIPELLDIIFNFLDANANVANARVCKIWSDVALDVVWRDVDDFLHLFRLLKPISCNDTSLEYLFDALPEASDWARFAKYARRVRSLKFRSTQYNFGICCLLDDVARTRTSLEILPNMHTLEWIYTDPYHMERCKLFLHRRLRTLFVSAPSQLDPRPDFYTDLCARAPCLHTLALFPGFPGTPVDAELHVLLQNLPELKKIILPEFYYTSTAIEHLSRATNIAVVDFSQDLNLGYGDLSNVASFSPVLERGAFPCLRELNLSVRVDDLDRFFRASFAPAHLTTLYVNAYTEHTPTQVYALLVTLSERCPTLSKLVLQLYHRVLPPSLPADQQLSYATIKPILAFPHLVAFELVHKLPLQMTHDDVEDLATKWPHVECLLLNVEPLFIDVDACTLDLGALVPFARHCPRLRVLGLYINASAAHLPPSDADAPLPAPFTTLETLAVGTSRARDTSAVAAFLSHLCPPGCTLEMGLTWTESGMVDERYLPVEVRRLVGQRCLAWQAVERVLPALVQLRREERARSRALQDEVEDLRVRNRLLMDRTEGQSRDSCVVA